jgi:ammonia channel protein AmtB
LFYGHHEAGQLWAQCLAGGVCIAWNLLVGGGVFYLIGQVLGPNRVPPQVEIAGLDIPEMGTPGYPEFITHGPGAGHRRRHLRRALMRPRPSRPAGRA